MGILDHDKNHPTKNQCINDNEDLKYKKLIKLNKTIKNTNRYL